MIGTKIKNLKGEAQYESYQPIELSALYSQIENHPQILDLVTSIEHLKGRVQKKRARLASHTKQHLKTANFLDSLVLENMHVSMQELNTLKSSFHPRKNTILHFIEANDYLLEKRLSLPISVRFIKDAHYAFYSEAAVFDKYAGEFKRSQNWISKENKSLKEADYVCPNVEDTLRLMQELERFIYHPNVNPFLLATLVLYQCESIQPFLTGNAFIARFLVDTIMDELNIPCLGLSRQIKANKTAYDTLLYTVKESDDIVPFIVLILSFIKESYENQITKIDALTALHKKENALLYKKISDPEERATMRQVLRDFEEVLVKPYEPNPLYAKLHELKLLELQRGLMQKNYMHKRYLSILSGEIS